MSFKRALSMAVFSAVVMTGIAANATEKPAAKADGSAPVAQSQGVTPDHPAVKKQDKDTKQHGATVTKDGKGAASVVTPAEQKKDAAPVAKAPEAKTGEVKTPEAKTDPAPVKTN